MSCATLHEQHETTSKHSYARHCAYYLQPCIHSKRMLYTQTHAHTPNTMCSPLAVQLKSAHRDCPYAHIHNTAVGSGIGGARQSLTGRERGEPGDNPRCPVHAVSTGSIQETAEDRGRPACRHRCLAAGAASVCARHRHPGGHYRHHVVGSRSAWRRCTGTERWRPAAAARQRAGPRVRRARGSPAPPSVQRVAPACARCVPTLTRSPCPG